MTTAALNTIAVVLLLAANAFFVAAEFALVRVRRFRMESRAEQGSAAARLTLRMLDNLEAYLAACQLGITMASLGLGWAGEPAVAALLEPLFRTMGMSDALLHTVAFLVGFLLFSSLHIVVGEQVPKTFAIRQAEPMALAVAYPLQAFYLLWFPLNWALNRASQAMLSGFGVKQATHGDVLTSEELREYIVASRAHGGMRKQERDMLGGILDLAEVEVSEIMTHRKSMEMIDADTADRADPRAGRRQPPFPSAGLARRPGQHRRHPARQGPVRRGASPRPQARGPRFRRLVQRSLVRAGHHAFAQTAGGVPPAPAAPRAGGR